MPWKSEIATPQQSNLNDLSKIVTLNQKNKVENADYSKYASDVQAILVNPPWNCTNPLASNQNSKSKSESRVSIEDFKKNFKIPTTVMKDGLVFIWVEKEIIYDLIKCFEA